MPVVELSNFSGELRAHRSAVFAVLEGPAKRLAHVGVWARLQLRPAQLCQPLYDVAHGISSTIFPQHEHRPLACSSSSWKTPQSQYGLSSRSSISSSSVAAGDSMVMADTPPAWSIDWWSWLLTSNEVERLPLRGILGDNVLEVAAQSSSVTRATYPLDGSKALTVSIRHFCRMFAAKKEQDVTTPLRRLRSTGATASE